MKRFKGRYPFPVLFADGGGGENNDDESKKKVDDNKPDEGNEEKKPFATFPTEAALMARINQGSESKLRKLAEELGFDSVEVMKEAAKKAKELEEQSKTELEKEKSRAERLEQENSEIKEKANQKLINAELKVFAAQFGFVDPQDAVALVDRAEIQVSEEGVVSGAKEAIEALAKSKPHLTGKQKNTQGGGSFNSGDTGGGLSEEEIGAKLAEERAKRLNPEVGKGVLNPWGS